LTTLAGDIGLQMNYKLVVFQNNESQSQTPCATEAKKYEVASIHTLDLERLRKYIHSHKA